MPPSHIPALKWVLSVAASELETDVSLKMVVEGPAIDQNMVERESVLFVVNSFDIWTSTRPVV